LGADTTGDYVANLVSGTGITITDNSGEGMTPVIKISDSYSSNIANTITAAEASAVSFASNAANTAYANAVIYVNNRVLDDIADVNISNVADGDFLRYNYNASAWINDPVNLATDTVGDYVQSLVAGTGITLSNATAAEGSTPTIAVTANTFDAHGAAAAAYSNAVSYVDSRTINDLFDVTISSVSNGDFLRYNGSVWINDPVNLSTDTVGDYVANLTSGAGITITNLGGEGADPTIAVTANTFDAHGSASAAQAAAVAIAAAALSNHELDITNIHGISNTAALVTLTGTQTLTNKTLTSPIITGISPTITLDGDLSGSVTLTNLSNANLIASIASTFEYVEDITAGTNIVVTDDGIGIAANHIYSISTSANPSFNSISTESCVINNIEIDPTGASVGQILKFNGNKFVPSVDNVAAAGLLNIEDLSNVTITSVSSGQVLKWNGNAWVNAVDVAGTTINSLDDIGDVNITTVQNGDLLKWNGSAWVNAGGYALLASPTFTGTVSGITKTMVGLGNVDDTSDADKPVSTAAQTALDLKAPLASPTFTGTVSGITKTMVGLGNVDDTSDADKPVSTAAQTALDLKANLDSPTFTGTVTLPADAVGSLDDIGDVTILTSILQAGQRSYI